MWTCTKHNALRSPPYNIIQPLKATSNFTLTKAENQLDNHKNAITPFARLDSSLWINGFSTCLSINQCLTHIYCDKKCYNCVRKSISVCCATDRRRFRENVFVFIFTWHFGYILLVVCVVGVDTTKISPFGYFSPKWSAFYCLPIRGNSCNVAFIAIVSLILLNLCVFLCEADVFIWWIVIRQKVSFVRQLFEKRFHS